MRRRLIPARLSIFGAAALAIGALAGCGHAEYAPSATAPTTTFSIPTAPSSASTTCDYKTQWQAPTGNVGLDDLAITGPGQGWAVGELTNSSPSTPPTGVVYQLSHGIWTRLPQTYPNADLSVIAMGSPTDGWAASSTVMTTGHDDRALVLHYIGGQWRQVDIPALDAVLKGPPGTVGNAITSLSIQMFGPNAGWMFAFTNVPRDLNNPDSREETIILRYTNGAWTSVPMPNLPTITTAINGIAAVSSTEVWAALSKYDASAPTTSFAHYVNGAWRLTSQTFPGYAGGLTMASPTVGWAVYEQSGSGPTGLLHYNGSVWRLVALPADWPSKRLNLGRALYTTTSGAIWFAVTAYNSGAISTLVAQYASGRWRQIPWPYTNNLPARVIADSAGDLWGIGDIDHQQGCPPLLTTFIPQGVFYHQSQGKWTEQVLA